MGDRATALGDGFVDRFRGKLRADAIQRRMGGLAIVVGVMLVAMALDRRR